MRAKKIMRFTDACTSPNEIETVQYYVEHSLETDHGLLFKPQDVAGNQRISYCYLNSEEEEAGRITLLFNRFHNAGRTLLYVCTVDCNGKGTKALASLRDDITLDKFLSLLVRSDLFKEYDTFVMLMKEVVPLLTYKEEMARECAEKEILAKLQPVLDELVASGKLDELDTGYGPDIAALKRIVDKGIARAAKKRG